ncbi:hypothetical protein CDAR_478471 [Caerostris darwini]|uniref:Uncharacterized protein n=1 Tax=Caerostris darwini TaxID=1538125 RepID=A0AAV4VC43_9ARAC|nr:hypothetical protein CDAR_478471 [Caerostris darwini]
MNEIDINLSFPPVLQTRTLCFPLPPHPLPTRRLASDERVRRRLQSKTPQRPCFFFVFRLFFLRGVFLGTGHHFSLGPATSGNCPPFETDTCATMGAWAASSFQKTEMKINIAFEKSGTCDYKRARVSFAPPFPGTVCHHGVLSTRAEKEIVCARFSSCSSGCSRKCRDYTHLQQNNITPGRLKSYHCGDLCPFQFAIHD